MISSIEVSKRTIIPTEKAPTRKMKAPRLVIKFWSESQISQPNLPALVKPSKAKKIKMLPARMLGLVKRQDTLTNKRPVIIERKGVKIVHQPKSSDRKLKSQVNKLPWREKDSNTKPPNKKNNILETE